MFSLSFLTENTFAQARMVMNNNVFMVINNSATLVVANANSNAISTLGSGGNIVSENEYNRIKWNIGNSTGSYTIPFSNTIGIKIPLNMNITSAGSGAGVIWFSTYNGSTWDNNTYRPSDVTHMNSLATALNNSANVIDRFWMIDPLGFTTKPSGNFTLSYIDAEYSAVGNTITESSLQGQRFNNSINSWGDYLPTGLVNTVANTVSNITFNNTDFFRSWTLVNGSYPLPVELLYYNYECGITLHWATASELNNAFFLIEESDNGFLFHDFVKINGKGTTNYLSTYEVNASNNKYYRLSQTDFDGTRTELGIVYPTCEADDAFTAWQLVDAVNTIQLNGLIAGNLKVDLFDVNGKIIQSQSFTVNDSARKLNLTITETGVYVVRFINENQTICKKVFLTF